VAGWIWTLRGNALDMHTQWGESKGIHITRGGRPQERAFPYCNNNQIHVQLHARGDYLHVHVFCCSYVRVMPPAGDVQWITAIKSPIPDMAPV